MQLNTNIESPEQALSPADPHPRGFDVAIGLQPGVEVTARADTYSDRLRCDHPQVSDGVRLGEALKSEAAGLGVSLVVVLGSQQVAAGLEQGGFQQVAVIPGFYWGKDDCHIFTYALSSGRALPAFAEDVAMVDELAAKAKERHVVPSAETAERASSEDAEQIASLIAATFDQYPTPSGVPGYIEKQISSGIPFRVVKVEGKIVACASADLVRIAGAAELTDCATNPEWRGHGYMQTILNALMGDLRQMGYPTAFTLARARIPGVNLAFRRLGFHYYGRMTRSCRIGSGPEDMNVWARPVA